GDQTWDIVGRDYIVTKGVTVIPGVNLTINPGVIVKFDPGTYLAVNGTLRALGEPYPSDPVRFIPVSDGPAPMDWMGLRFLESSENCLLEYSTISYASYAINITGTTSPVISNCTIEYSFFHGIYCGAGSTPFIRNNFINFSEWGGIICDNRSHAIVQGNEINTCLYGIICYDVAELSYNTIKTCWIGIVCWGDANVTYNEVRDCMDGIHGFYAAPRIEHNDVVSCDGNGTRFIMSNATVRYNTFRYNDVGMDISYDSRNVLVNMEGNTVNGIDIQKCYLVNQNDIVIEGLFADSGWSSGYYGLLTAQGSVTLYDCHNVIFRDCNITNTMNAIYGTNSSFFIYNTWLGNARRSQVYLDRDAWAMSYNGSVDADMVSIGGDNCLFISHDDLMVRVLDHDLEPIEGARVAVRESFLELHNVTTDSNGWTPNLVVKDRTVSESGVIASPLNVEVFAEEYNFESNPQTGIYVSENHTVTFIDLGDIEPPEVLGASIQDGDRSTPVNASISIYFSEPMNHTSVEQAFSISGNVTGAFAWSGYNLTFTPSHDMAFQTYYTVTLETGARDLNDNHITAAYTVSFTTLKESSEASSWMMMGVFVVIFLAAGIAGWVMIRKMK
ncbi:MAG: Ig-like domain-containing protein, partial [Thermoplasmata archaeon]|nr:Ig-like domain-containing protein [Thermoplasmata archaeon]